jgi:hypothetical protein
MNTTPQELSTRITNTLHQKKPLPKIYFTLLFCISIFAGVLLTCLTVFSLTFFVWDIFRMLGDVRPTPGSIFNLIRISFLECLIIAGVAVFVVYRIIRSFDTQWTKHVGLIVGLGCAGLLGLAAAGFIIVNTNPPVARFFDRLNNDTTQLPNHRNRPRPLRRMPGDIPPRPIDRPFPKNP